MSGAKNLKRNRILDAPIAVNLPGLNRIEVSRNRSRRFEELRFNLPEFRKFNNGGLLLAALVDAARLQNGFFAIPVPSESKSHVRLGIHSALHFRLFPAFSVVRGYFDLADEAAAGPRQAADFVKARSGQFLSARRARNHRTRP